MGLSKDAQSLRSNLTYKSSLFSAVWPSDAAPPLAGAGLVGERATEVHVDLFASPPIGLAQVPGTQFEVKFLLVRPLASTKAEVIRCARRAPQTDGPRNLDKVNKIISQVLVYGIAVASIVSAGGIDYWFAKARANKSCKKVSPFCREPNPTVAA
jgi:hypothetical protein